MSPLRHALLNRTRFAITIVALVGIMSPGRAQSPLPPDSWVLGNAWMSTWTPLSPIGDLPRRFPAAPPVPGLLVAPAPRMGLFWSAGNPGALAAEVDSAYAGFAVHHVALTGSYHRPLDPTDAGTTDASAAGWRRLGTRGAALGRATMGRSTFDGSTFAVGVDPYTSSPGITTDTITSQVGRSSAALDGALGWQLGGWGMGLTAGYNALDNRSAHSPRARTGRAAQFGGAVGITRALPASLVLGVHGRGLRRVETTVTSANPQTATIYQLAGYDDVPPIDVPLGQQFYRRVQRDGSAATVSLGAHVLGAAITLWGERGVMHEAQTSMQSNNPRGDVWRTRADRTGAAAQRGWRDNRLLVSAKVERLQIDGSGARADLSGTAWLARENQTLVQTEARLVPAGSHWSAAGSFALERRTSSANDYVATLYTDVRSWMPGGAMELAFLFTPRAAVAAGYAMAAYYPLATIPKGETRGPAFQRFLAPELEFYGSRSSPRAFSLTGRLTVNPGTRLLLALRHGSLSPTGSGAPTPFAPSGTRAATDLAIAVTVGR
ncbi:MAG: hypothetical protein ACR2OG_03765 [Gemmatimonadaceae bacterium]